MTIQQIQDRITNKGDLREIVNLLADYIQNNPATSDPGYLVYTANFTQLVSNNSNITDYVMKNTIGTLTWSRQGTGFYRLSSNGLFTVGKTYSPQFAPTDNNYGAGICYFGHNQNPPLGFVVADFVNSSTIDFYSYIDNGAGSQVADLYQQISPGVLPLEIRVYP